VAGHGFLQVSSKTGSKLWQESLSATVSSRMSLLLTYLCPNQRVSDKFTEEDKKRFADDEYYRKFRWELESEMNVIVFH
jgi:hypothetical protein